MLIFNTVDGDHRTCRALIAAKFSASSEIGSDVVVFQVSFKVAKVIRVTTGKTGAAEADHDIDGLIVVHGKVPL
jgi:hypothetical protein